jgi:hypothetical protein
MEQRAEALDVVQGAGAERRADFLERPTGGFPEERAGQRL